MRKRLERRCCVKGCDGRGGHVFPVKPSVRQLWLEALNLPADAVTNRRFVCRKHFKESDYNRYFEAGAFGKARRLRLTGNAVPSLCETSSTEQSTKVGEWVIEVGGEDNSTHYFLHKEPRVSPVKSEIEIFEETFECIDSLESSTYNCEEPIQLGNTLKNLGSGEDTILILGSSEDYLSVPIAPSLTDELYKDDVTVQREIDISECKENIGNVPSADDYVQSSNALNLLDCAEVYSDEDSLVLDEEPNLEIFDDEGNNLLVLMEQKKFLSFGVTPTYVKLTPGSAFASIFSPQPELNNSKRSLWADKSWDSFQKNERVVDNKNKMSGAKWHKTGKDVCQNLKRTKEVKADECMNRIPQVVDIIDLVSDSDDDVAVSELPSTGRGNRSPTLSLSGTSYNTLSDGEPEDVSSDFGWDDKGSWSDVTDEEGVNDRQLNHTGTHGSFKHTVESNSVDDEHQFTSDEAAKGGLMRKDQHARGITYKLCDQSLPPKVPQSGPHAEKSRNNLIPFGPYQRFDKIVIDVKDKHRQDTDSVTKTFGKAEFDVTVSSADANTKLKEVSAKSQLLQTKKLSNGVSQYLDLSILNSCSEIVIDPSMVEDCTKEGQRFGDDDGSSSIQAEYSAIEPHLTEPVGCSPPIVAQDILPHGHEKLASTSSIPVPRIVHSSHVSPPQPVVSKDKQLHAQKVLPEPQRAIQSEQSHCQHSSSNSHSNGHKVFNNKSETTYTLGSFEKAIEDHSYFSSERYSLNEQLTNDTNEQNGQHFLQSYAHESDFEDNEEEDVLQPLTCHHCDELFASQELLQYHIVRVHSGHELVCPECGVTFTSALDCNSHIGESHAKEDNTITYLCPHCEFTTADNAKLRAHLDTKHRTPKMASAYGNLKRFLNDGLQPKSDASDGAAEEGFKKVRNDVTRFRVLSGGQIVEFPGDPVVTGGKRSDDPAVTGGKRNDDSDVTGGKRSDDPVVTGGKQSDDPVVTGGKRNDSLTVVPCRVKPPAKKLKLRCPRCIMTFETIQLLNIHVLTRHKSVQQPEYNLPVKPMSKVEEFDLLTSNCATCPICKESLPRKDIVKHYRYHKCMEKLQVCEHCSFTSTVYKVKLLHKMITHGVKPLISNKTGLFCPACHPRSTTYIDLATLIVHCATKHEKIFRFLSTLATTVSPLQAEYLFDET